MKEAPHTRGDWLANIKNYYEIQRVLTLHPELNCWIIFWDGKTGLKWMELNEAVGQIQPFHFEIRYGKESTRDAYYLRMLKEAQKSERLTVGELFGFHDMFLPVSVDTKRRTFLYAGQFCQEPLEWDRICQIWRDLSGQTPASANTEFSEFVRAALRVPILDQQVVKEFESFLLLYAEFLTGSNRSDLHTQVNRLRDEVFSRYWPRSDWVKRAIDHEEHYLTPWYHETEFSDWMKADMQICRLPTTAMALMPVYSPDKPLDPNQRMVVSARIQHECLKCVMDMPETAAHKLQDYGVSFLTSTAPGRNASRAKLELRERAQKLQALVKERFGMHSVVGIGRSVPPGEPLYTSHTEAVLALHLCVQLTKDVLFFEAEHGAEGTLTYSHLHEASVKLADAFNRDSMDEIKVAADDYVRLVLIYADERIEVVRSQFLVTVFQLIQGVQRRHVLRKEAVDRVAEELGQKIEQAQSVYQVIAGFNEAITRLWFFSSKALEGPKSMRLSTTLQYLRDNFAEPLRLPQVARKAGFSVPAFSRIFKQATGTSFLGYLRALRVAQAKRLLRTTSLSTEQVAHACGFQSQHHLIRSFKKVATQTPGSYRKAARSS